MNAIDIVLRLDRPSNKIIFNALVTQNNDQSIDLIPVSINSYYFYICIILKSCIL